MVNILGEKAKQNFMYMQMLTMGELGVLTVCGGKNYKT